MKPETREAFQTLIANAAAVLVATSPRCDYTHSYGEACGDLAAAVIMDGDAAGGALCVDHLSDAAGAKLSPVRGELRYRDLQQSIERAERALRNEE